MRTKAGLVIVAVLAGLTACDRLGWGGKCEGPNDVKIVSFQPTGLLERPQDLEVQFSRLIVADDKVGSDLDAALLTITPNLEHTCKWHSQSVARCYLRGFKPATSYQAEVNQGLMPAETKLKLCGEKSWSFKLEGLKVKSVTMSVLPGSDPPRLGLTLNFNNSVDPNEVERRLKILAPDGNTLPFQFTYGREASDTLQIETYLNRFDPKTWKAITVTIEAGLPDRARLSTLEQAYRRQVDLPVAGPLKVTNVILKQTGAVSLIQVCFSESVDSAIVPAFVKLDPPKEFRVENEGKCSNLVGDFQPGEHFTVTVQKGLKPPLGGGLDTDFSQTVTFSEAITAPDLKASATLLGDGHYLPRRGAMNLGLETVNRDLVMIRVKKIFANNLVHFLGAEVEEYCGYYEEEEQTYYSRQGDECRLSRNLEVLGKEILQKEITIAKVKNRIVTTPLPLEDLVGKDRQGIYAVGVYKDKNSWYSEAFVWLIATDLGIVAHKSDDQLVVMVRSLESLQPVSGARVRLYSKNNQVMVEGQTDGKGMARFPGLAETFKQFNPYLIVAEKGDDYSFLAFSQAELNTSSFDVSGDQYASGHYEAFLYPERDIYRPGETAHLAYLIRDRNLKAPESFPVTLQVKTPDNRLHLLLKSQPDALASGEFEVPFPRESLTGAYAVELYGSDEKPIGRTQLRLEEFMPDRIKAVVSADQERYLAGESIPFSVQANYLFGPPAGNRKVKASCYIEERAAGFRGFDEFQFGNQTADPIKPLDLSLGEINSDETGKASFTCSVPKDLRPRQGALSATVQATVFEPGGGRAVSGRRMLPVDPFPVYVGSRPDFKGEPQPQQKLGFSVIALTPQGKPAKDRELLVTFYKMEWYTVLKLVENRYRYVSEQRKNQVSQEKVASKDQPVSVSFTSASSGSYAIEVEDQAGGARALAQFDVWGWGYSPWAMENPDRIELQLDKAEYLPGEEAKVLVKAPFGGKLILTVENQQVLDTYEYDLAENTATLTIPVRESFRPNAYLVATLLRSFKSVEKFAPLRAAGVVPLRLASKPERLEVKIEAPENIRPNTTVEVTVKVAGGGGGRVTLAAVDEGILRLTGFVTPDPLAHFYRKRRLPFSLYDIYSMILPEVIPVPPRSPSGGDLDRERLKRELVPLSAKRVVPVSFWSGLVNLSPEGSAKVSVPVPQFNGTLRLMAVAFTRDKIGDSESPLIVRDPVTITSSLPRFLAPGDKFVIPVTIMNGTGRRGDFTVSVETEGKVKLTESKKSAFLEKDAESTQRFQAQAVPAIGTDKITIRASGGGETSVEQTELAIRPFYPLYSKTEVRALTAGQPVTIEFPKDWVPGTEAFKLAISKAPTLKYSESLRYLVSYPYGCIEQTTSKAFPLLYFNDLAKFMAPDLFAGRAVDYYVNEAVNKLISMNYPDGAFSYWPGERGNAHPWASVYAAHFLLEAKKANYNVPDLIVNRSLDYLRAFTNTQKIEKNETWRCREVSYALYVLALAAKPNRNVMDWMLDSDLCKVTEDLEMRSLLAGAYLAAGDDRTGERLLPVGGLLAKGEIETGYTFYSPVRAEGLALNILVEYRPNHPSIPGLLKALTDSAQGGRWHNTQANAFAFLALGKYYRTQEKADFTGTVKVNGNQLADFDPAGLSLKASDWAGKKAELSLQGKGTAYVYWEASGVPLNPPEIKAEDRGLAVRKQYLNEDGQPLDLEKVPQGSLVVVKVTIQALDRGLDNVVMADLLPAGLEIENPRLLTTAPPEWIDKQTRRPQYLDIRDDRMMTFQSVHPGSNFDFYYALRAVTAGEFVLPPVKAEAMYDPSYRSITAPGTIKVIERQ